MIWLSWQTLRIEELYAAVVALAVIGILFRFTIVMLTKRLVPWQSRESS
jgi:ABC-type nitrate/sulfonate/bicarbonate transport system permease component